MRNILYSEVVPKFPEHRFRDQYIQFTKRGYYILDFYCETLQLGIEVDGPIHDEKERDDRERDAV